MLSSSRILPATALAVLAAAPLLADVVSIRELIRSGRFAEAIAQCDRELKVSPSNPALHTVKGLALLGAGERSSSLAAFRRALSVNGAYEPALKAAAQIEFESRDPAARATLETLLKVSPGSETAHAMLGVLLFEKRECALALNHIEKAPSMLEAPAVRWPYGVCLMELGRWPAAASQFAALLQLREHPPTRYNLALAYFNAKDFQAAVRALAPYQSGAIDADVARLYSSALESAGDTPNAFAVLQRAIGQHPGDERLLIDLAVLCMDHQAFDLGIEVTQAGIGRSPSSARLHTLRGVLLARRGDTEPSRQAFERAQELSPQSGLGAIGLASILMQMGLAGDAVQLLRRQMAEGEQDSKTQLTLAKALLLKSPTTDETREAVRLLEKVVASEPVNAAAHGLLGKSLAQLGETRRAAVELAAAIRLDPLDRVSTYQLMLIYRRTGKTAEAAQLARRVQSLLDKERDRENTGSRFQVVRGDDFASSRK